MNPYLTTYRKDYIPKTAKRPELKGTTSEFKDPICEGFKSYLQLSSVETPPKPPLADADGYVKEHGHMYPKHAKLYFQEPLNNPVIEKSFVYNGRTAYQVDYCDLEKDKAFREEQRKKQMYRLPDNWDIPITTQKYSYRNPCVINSRALEPVGEIRPPNNLGDEEHIRKLLKITTGKSEYAAVMGELGEIIINEQLHGKIVHPKCTCAEHNPQNKDIFEAKTGN